MGFLERIVLGRRSVGVGEIAIQPVLQGEILLTECDVFLFERDDLLLERSVFLTQFVQKLRLPLVFGKRGCKEFHKRRQRAGTCREHVGRRNLHGVLGGGIIMAFSYLVFSE